MTGIGPLLIATSIGSLFSQPFGMKKYGVLHFGLWALTLLSLPLSYWAIRLEVGEYFTSKHLANLRASRS